MIQTKNGQPCVAIQPVKWSPNLPEARYLRVATVWEESPCAILTWMLLDAQGNIVYQLDKENPKIEGDDYAAWDGNDPLWVYNFVAQKEKLIIL